MAELARSEGNTSAGSIFDLVRRGQARTRGEIARATGLAPSTVSLRMETLLQSGLLTESTAAVTSGGGRPPRFLKLNPSALAVVGASLGEQHFSLSIADQTGTELAHIVDDVDVGDGPDAVIDVIWSRTLAELARLGIPTDRVAGMSLGVPAPVDPVRGVVTTAARLPGWGNRNLFEIFHRRAPITLVLANDANLLAIAEYQQADPSVRYMLAVKAGSRIGSGMIVDRRLVAGVSGAAGEISHSSTHAQSIIRCFCGTENCLESVASGSAMVAKLQRAGYLVSSTTDIVALGSAGEPGVLEVLTESARLVGEALAPIVNFLNPDLVTFGGSLAISDAFVATVRGTIFQECLPVITAGLDVRAGHASRDPETAGGVQLALDTVLGRDAIDRWLSRETPRSTPGDFVTE